MPAEARSKPLSGAERSRNYYARKRAKKAQEKLPATPLGAHEPLAAWIERHVVLPQAISAQPGPMRLWPFHKGIVDAIEDPKVERITIVKPVRVGFSTLLHAATAWYVCTDPCPILSVLPTDADCRRVMVGELERIFDESPDLSGMLPEAKSGAQHDRQRSTLLHRQFPNGSLKFVAARAPRNLRGPTARVLFIDEVDGMVETAEGNPIDLAVDRTTSFANRKIIIGSTPGDEETSLILPLYEQSDKRVFQVPCPLCGTFTEILWEHIEWEPDSPLTAAFRCPSCHGLVDERHKPAMVAAGQWQATGTPGNGHAGFRLNALVSLLANTAWGKLAADFLLKKDDRERHKTFVNRFLGQGWRNDTANIDDLELAARAEDFSLDKIPVEVIFLTAGVDVQDDRLEMTLCGWDRNGGCLILGHIVIWGSPDDDYVWEELNEYLRTQWRHPHGGQLRIDAMCVDSGDGDWTDKVYSFCFPRARRFVMAIKGRAEGHALKASEGKVKGAGKLWIVGVNTIKTTLLDRLKKFRAIRFSNTLEAAFFEQLTSERRVVKFSRGRPRHHFERITGRRAEALDCTVYAFAAKERLQIQAQADRREDELRVAPTPPPATMPKRPPPQRDFIGDVPRDFL